MVNNMREAVSFKPDAAVIADSDEVHAVSRRGVVTLRAPGLGRLYLALRPHINGSNSLNEVIKRVPDHLRKATTNLLLKLEAAGAVAVSHAALSVAKDDGPSRGFLGAWVGERPHTVISCGNEKVFLSLDGPIVRSPESRRCIYFVRSENLRDELIRAGPKTREVIYVLAEPGQDCRDKRDDGELATRAEYARWLLNRLDWSEPPQPGRFTLYHLDFNRGSLLRLLECNGRSPSDRSEIPKKLGLITMLPANQCPLVSLRAHHNIFCIDISRYGIKSDLLYDELILEFLRELVLWKNRRSMRAHQAIFGNAKKRVSSVVRLTPEDMTRGPWSVADSPLAARALALEMHFAKGKQRAKKSKAVDLLQVHSGHADVLYLQSILRLRTPTLNARQTLVAHGGISYEASGHRTYSLIGEKALRDLLLALTWAVYYPKEAVAPQIGADFTSFVSHSALVRLVEEGEDTLAVSGKHRVLLHRARIWDRNLWMRRIDAF